MKLETKILQVNPAKQASESDSIFIRCYKAEGEKKKKPVVLVHGMWSSGDIFDQSQWAMRLCLTGRDVYVLSLRGHGEEGRLISKPLGHMTIEEYYHDVCNVIDWVSVEAPCEDISIVGHSMGGLLALRVSQTYPLRHVSIINSAPPRGILQRGVSSWLLPLYLWPILRKKAFALSRKHRELLLGNRLATYGPFKNMCLESGQVALDILLGGMSVSTKRKTRSLQVISGGVDRMVSPKIQRHIADRYKGEYVYFPEMSHMAMMSPWSSDCLERIQAHISKV